MSAKAIRETLGFIGVIASMVFVGLEIQQNTIASQAEAYQAIGIATSEWHRYVDARLDRLITETAYPEALERWTLSDWDRHG